MKDSSKIKFEEAVRLITEHFPSPGRTDRKPILDHCIRVGTYLSDKGYSEEIVLAGLLHDSIEQTNSIGEDLIKKIFGYRVLELILASTKDYSIKESNDRNEELIKRCISVGQDALIVKTADIIDSFKWYYDNNNKNELDYCINNAENIIKYKPVSFDDRIFDELTLWMNKIK